MTAAQRRARSTADGRAGLRALSVGEIVETGLRLGVDDGFENLSMRTLARELGVSTMALYHHVPNKRGLDVLLVDTVLRSVPIPPPEAGDWQDRLRALNSASVEVLSRFPGLDRMVFGMPPTPEGWRLMNGYVQILLDAGFSEREAALAFSVLHSHGMGRTIMERDLRRSRQRSDQVEVSGHPSLPALDRLNGHWKNLHRPAYRDFAMDVILAGLRATLQSSGSVDAPSA